MNACPLLSVLGTCVVYTPNNTFFVKQHMSCESYTYLLLMYPLTHSVITSSKYCLDRARGHRKIIAFINYKVL